MQPTFSDPRVESIFAAYPPTLRTDLLKVRRIIFAAAEDMRIGALTEALKWGQPAYMPAKPRIGSTVRIDALEDPDCYGVFFHCRTSLVSTFRTLYPQEFTFQGNRAIVLFVGCDLPAAALKHCVSLALTYHLMSNRWLGRSHLRKR